MLLIAYTRLVLSPRITRRSTDSVPASMLAALILTASRYPVIFAWEMTASRIRPTCVNRFMTFAVSIFAVSILAKLIAA